MMIDRVTFRKILFFQLLIFVFLSVSACLPENQASNNDNPDADTNNNNKIDIIMDTPDDTSDSVNNDTSDINNDTSDTSDTSDSDISDDIADAGTDTDDDVSDITDAGTDTDGGNDVINDPSRCLLYDAPNQLIADRHFQRGFINVDQTTAAEIAQMPTGLCPDSPVWQFVFGNSPSTLASQPIDILSSGAVQWDDIYGHLIVGPGGTAEADLISAVWGYEVYGGTYYVPSAQQGWLFHLAQQQISIPGVYSSGSPPVSALQSLDFSVFAKLLTADQNIQSGYDSNVHAAQYLIYFTIQNQNNANPGFGDYLWFGITIYDDRRPVPGLVVLQDSGGTERLIYNIGADPFVDHPFTVNGPGMLFAGDLLPYIRDALHRAWENGFLTGSNNLADYRIGGMNIGWEVSGLNDVEVLVKDLSLLYQTKTPQDVIFDFDTDGDTEGWTAVNINDTNGGPVGGYWIFAVPGSAPMLTSPELSVEAATHRTIRIIIANDHNPADGSVLKIYWDRFGQSGFYESWSKSVAITNGGGFQTITLDMTNTPGWFGEISHIRVDPILYGDGHSVGIDQIAILATP